MPPKKKEQQKMSLGDFLTDSGFGGGSWADEVEETVVTGTQPLPPSDRFGARSSGFGGGGSSSWADRGYSVREPGPQTLPDKPPYTAHVGNLSYDATVESVTDFFSDCNVSNVRIIEDRENQRPKGFGYVEFGDLEGLKKALTLDGESFEGRMMKIKIADPPRGGDSGRGDFIRDMGDWTRKGPLEPLPQRGGGGGRDFSERRPPRDPAVEGKSARDLTWERRGPLPPPAEDPAREGRQRPAPEGMGERSESGRGPRRQAPAWGEGRTDGSRPPRKEYQERPERPERPERTPTAAEMDNKWRDSMRPAAPAAPAASESPKTSTPASPEAGAAAPAAGASRPKLNLAKRTVSEAPQADAASSSGDSKASPFGAARPINTAAREKEIEEKRQQALKEKKEADEKAKEERRLAKEAAAKAEEEAKTAEPEAPAEEKAEEPKAEGAENANGAAEKTMPVRNREPRSDAPKPRAFEGGNWRSEGRPRGGQAGGRGGRGGAPRGPRTDRDQRENRNSRSGPPPGQQQAPDTPTEPDTPTQDEDGWTTVPAGKKGRPGRPMA